MSKVWEFALTPKRLAIVAGCLGLAGIVLAAVGFAAGVMVAPGVRSDLAVITDRAPRDARALLPASKAPAKPQPAPTPASEASARPAAPPPLAAATPATAGAGNAEGAKKASPMQLDVRVASFTSAENAQNTVAQLKSSGYPAFDVLSKDASSREWHVVQVGPYAAYDSASRTVLELSTKYRFDPVIVASQIN